LFGLGSKLRLRVIEESMTKLKKKGEKNVWHVQCLKEDAIF
jgi:hypothetical protein